MSEKPLEQVLEELTKLEKADKGYYKILGLEVNSSQSKEDFAAALKKAHRSMSMKYHPDRNNGSEVANQIISIINKANDTLKCPKNRAAYDEHGHSYQEAMEQKAARTENVRNAAEILNEKFGSKKEQMKRMAAAARTFRRK